MVELGTPAPDFTLPDAHGVVFSRDEIAAGRPLLVAFVCNHCPYVKHLEHEFGALTRDVAGLAIAAICTNDAEAYPDDAPARLAEQAERAGWDFPYLVDADQTVGRAYRAACTPDFFLFDAGLRLAYRGAFDDSTPGNKQQVTGASLREAIDRVLAGEAVPEPHRPSMGCSIKWRE